MNDEEAHALIAQGVKAITENRAAEDNESAPFLTAWIVSYEVDSIEMTQNEESGGGVIAPAGQSSHLSRGLAMSAVDFWGVRHA